MWVDTIRRHSQLLRKKKKSKTDAHEEAALEEELGKRLGRYGELDAERLTLSAAHEHLGEKPEKLTVKKRASIRRDMLKRLKAGSA